MGASGNNTSRPADKITWPSPLSDWPGKCDGGLASAIFGFVELHGVGSWTQKPAEMTHSNRHYGISRIKLLKIMFCLDNITVYVWFIFAFFHILWNTYIFLNTRVNHVSKFPMAVFSLIHSFKIMCSLKSYCRFESVVASVSVLILYI